jgi:hypothetical protein
MHEATALSYINPPPAPAIVVVDWDLGGRVDLFIARTQEYRATNRRIVIRGKCSSACTLALSLPNTCVEPSASMGFHAARWLENDTSVPPRQRGQRAPVETEQMWSSYPAAVQRRLGGLGADMVYLSGRELISLGVPACTTAQRADTGGFFSSFLR